MKTKHFVLTIAAALSCGAFTLLAQETPAPPPPPAGGDSKSPGGPGGPGGPPPGGHDRLAEFIKKTDTDGDGKVSKEELIASTKKEAEQRFSHMDANADGYADKTEIEEMGRKMREMSQRRPDAEGPGGFRRPDGDGPRRAEGGDGSRRPPEGGGDGTRPRPGQGDSQGGSPPPPGDGGFRRPDGDGPRRGDGDRPSSMGMMGDMLLRMDKDKDGTLTKEEFLSSSEERFAQMDENKDGKVTKDEVEAMGRRMREMMGGGGRPGGEGAQGGPGGFRRPEGDKRPNGERPKPPEGEAPAPPKGA